VAGPGMNFGDLLASGLNTVPVRYWQELDIERSGGVYCGLPASANRLALAAGKGRTSRSTVCSNSSPATSKS